MLKSRLVLLLVFASSVASAQIAGMGSMQDPRLGDQSAVGAYGFQPWLAVQGNYDTYLNGPSASFRSVSLNGGFSLAKAFHHTTLMLGYAGSGSDYLGASGSSYGWLSSNVVSLALSSRLTHRLIFDASEQGGAANGGFGITASGLQNSGLGVLGSLDAASGSLYGTGANVVGGASNPLNNGLVSSDYYDRMAYFSSTMLGLGYMVSSKTMVNVQATGSLVRREGFSYADSDSLSARGMVSGLSRRRRSMSGCPMRASGAPSSVSNSPSMADSVTG